jgi:hypothetical protein
VADNDERTLFLRPNNYPLRYFTQNTKLIILDVLIIGADVVTFSLHVVDFKLSKLAESESLLAIKPGFPNFAQYMEFFDIHTHQLGK